MEKDVLALTDKVRHDLTVVQSVIDIIGVAATGDHPIDETSLQHTMISLYHTLENIISEVDQFEMGKSPISA